MSIVSLPISRITVDFKNNQAFIICPSSKYNEKGAFRVSKQQLDNIAAQAGLVNGAQLIRNSKGAKFTFEPKHCKAGEEWVNRKTGETGEYTKDHWQINNQSVELSQAALFVIEAAANAASAFESMANSYAQPAEEVDEVTQHLENIAAEQEEVAEEVGEMQIVQPELVEQA